MVVHVDAMLAMQRAGSIAFDYGNNIRRFACDAGCADAFLIPGFVPEYIRPLFCTGDGLSAGLRFPAIRATSTAPMSSPLSSFPTTRFSLDG